jgi:TRAP-type C4-dicarboxylate transport system substrate-binding protein
MRPQLRYLVNGLVLTACLLLGAAAAAAQDVPRLRLSTENGAEHVQTQIVARFVERVRRTAGGRLVVDFQHSARLFRDADVVRAMRVGQVEMAVPGIWQLDGAEPSFALFLLPQFYGLGSAANYRVRDGALGRQASERLAANLRLQVLGRWIDLGFAHVFTIEPAVQSANDLVGLRIRLPGGEPNLWRLGQLGANPQVIPWPDVPNALRLRTVDGLVSTFEGVENAGLMRFGLRYAYEDHAYFAQYVPIVAGSFWSRLEPALQRLLAECWEAEVDEGRAFAAREQAEARARLLAQGMRIVTPSVSARAETRRRLLARQSDLVAALGIDPALVAMAADMTANSP